MKLDVPHYSQFLHVEDPYWMPRACGMACLKMILDFHLPAQAGGKTTPTLLEMCQAGEQDGGYSKSGWFHEHLLKVAREYGLNAERGENMLADGGGILGFQRVHDELKEGNPVIVSISKYTLGQTKFHMVVLTGYEYNENDSISGLYFNEPEALSLEHGKDVFVDIKDFRRDWRKMAIFIRP